MDVDNENFYDEISSLLPQPGDYSLEDLEEIIRSTDSHLDASLGINPFADSLDHNKFDTSIAELTLSDTEASLQQQFYTEDETHNKYNFSAFLSPSTTQQSAEFSPTYGIPARSSSPLSTNGEHFNPDDFINFFNDDDIKEENLTVDSSMTLDVNCRNIPSPTGSYTSSSGSSTSGIQSDASSVVSNSQNYKNSVGEEGDDELLEFLKFKNELSEQDIIMNEKSFEQSEQQFDNDLLIVKAENSIFTYAPTTNTLPLATVPVLPVNVAPVIQPINVVQGTIIPVQTVPLTKINSVANIKVPKPIEIENKSSNKIVASQTVKVGNGSGTNNSEQANTKVAPPPNEKPKTIYLSSNDFKALMQKMNSNDKNVATANGKTPKIIMKTANGKIISANKIANITKSNTSAAPVSSSTSNNNLFTTINTQSQQFVAKMSKTSSSMIGTQQSHKVFSSNTRSVPAMSAARAVLSHTKSSRTDYGILKGLNDDKLMKKQLRMLKNRESASLSRKKKKEYLERLENRISNLEKENYSLKGENSSLRSQLMAFAQTCSCNHGSVSEFILSTLNMDDKNNEAVLNLMNNAKRHLDNCSANSNNATASATRHVKIAPKPANASLCINKGFKQRMNASTIKKNVAVLFAMAFMVTLNVGNFQNYLNKSDLESAIDASATGTQEDPVVQTGRRLLWVPNIHEFHEQPNRTKREVEIVNNPPPPLHFLRPVNRTTADRINGSSAKDEPIIKKSSSATSATGETYANATLENMRLAKNLHKWIGDNGYLNLSGNGIDNDFEEMDHFKFGAGPYMDYDLPVQAPISIKQKRKLTLDSQTQETHGKHAKLNIDGQRNSLGIFKPRITEEYIRLFKGIKRQDDTFYVLSFNMDHILLPASVYNKSSRPKMSLMLPAGDPSLNGDIVLMQIDCEVINTTELEIKSHMIPEKLKPSKYLANLRVNANNVAHNETADPASMTAVKSKDLPLKKEKPSAPRTYFMMGPRNQAPSQSTNATNKESNTVKRKLNANDSVIGSGVLNVRNSSLFSRMRETVGSQKNGFVTPTEVKKVT